MKKIARKPLFPIFAVVICLFTFCGYGCSQYAKSQGITVTHAIVKAMDAESLFYGK